MPYLADKVARTELASRCRAPRDTGELNFVATSAALAFISIRAKAYGEKVGYDLISRAISGLEEAAAELRRRLLGPREDVAIEKNGDVYPAWLLEAVGAKAPTPHEPFWTDRPDFKYGMGGTEPYDMVREYERIFGKGGQK